MATSSLPESRSSCPLKDLEKQPEPIPTPLSETKTIVPSEPNLEAGKDSQHQLSKTHKRLILAALSGAQFFDIFNACSSVIALPTLGAELGFKEGSLQWMLSAYTLTFASFMLISGRLSDIFHPQPIFVIGLLMIGLFSIPVGASVNPTMAIVFRAIQGIGAALNVPSSIAMINIFFPDPAEQSMAYAVFSSSGAVGNVSGFILGGVLTAYVNWTWVFYLLAILVIPFGIASWFIIPKEARERKDSLKDADWIGVLTLTAGLILFVFALSDPSTPQAWAKPRTLVPLILSVFLIAAFFLIERVVKHPAVPPKTWTNKNFIPLFFYAWSPYWFFLGSELSLVQIFMDLWGLPELQSAIHCLPLGIAVFISILCTPWLSTKLSPRVLLFSGQLLMAGGSVLFALADDFSKYWSFIVPGMIIGMAGLGIAYTGCTVKVMGGARQGEEATVAAVMFTSYQIGATLGLAIMSSITTAINSTRALDPASLHAGYSAAFWSLLAFHGVMLVITAVFVRN